MKKLIHTSLGAALAAIGLAVASAGAVAGADHGHDLNQLRAQEKQRVQIYKAWFPDAKTGRKAAISFHANLLESNYEQGFLVLELNGAEIAKLQRFGFRIEAAPEFVAKRDEFVNAIQAAAAARLKSGMSAMAADAGIQAIPGFACYPTVEETFSIGDGLIKLRPKLASWVDIGDSWEKTKGLGGFDMRVLKLTNSAVGGSKPKLFINAAIHAREYATSPLVLHFARWLVEYYGRNADATWIMDNTEVHLLLHTNPDGRKKAEGGVLWRKNTNTAYCGATSVDRGADLNRNFSFSWNSTGGEGSSGDQCDQTYRGTGPASEPEIKAVEKYIRSLWPDRRGPGLDDAAPRDTSGIHLDIHSYSQLVLWPWGNTPAPSGNASDLQTLGRRFAWFNGYTPTQSIGLYPTDGTSDGPSYGELGVAAFTFELGTSFFQSCADFNNTIKPDNMKALVYAAKVVRAPYMLPSGPDVTELLLGGEPHAKRIARGETVEVTATITDVRFNNTNGEEPTQNITGADAYIGTPPWAPGAVAVPLQAVDGRFNDERTEAVRGVLPTGDLSAGRHIVYLQGRDASGHRGPVSAVFVDVEGGTPQVINLSVGAVPNVGTSHRVTLSFSGAVGSNVSVYRNGTLVGQTGNDGSYSELRLPGTWTYKVCQQGGSSLCSAEQSITLTAPVPAIAAK
ncbi:M14 family metallopeptidase [Eleftheria terrae]|uniref:M14 family metallopeptidase n=1 Tax=Eleftheria terrae TaxID=1597781 RepID=UPI00263B97F1|nr:M14 family metallopeptidase [Eleftheria terrae]WKB54125.1 M14 family metallopeptidase [Eleftheria terrae]